MDRDEMEHGLTSASASHSAEDGTALAAISLSDLPAGCSPET